MQRWYHALPLLLVAVLLAPALAYGQEVVPAEDKPSPREVTQATLDDTYMLVHYGSPRKRDRVIFGDLVPYGQVWRTGANEATEIVLTDDVMFGGQEVPAGMYTIFTVPGEDEWTVILNSDLGQWGNYNHNAENDVYSVTVPAMQMDDQMYEAFTMAFEEADEGVHLVMMWDQTKVAVPIMVN